MNMKIIKAGATLLALGIVVTLAAAACGGGDPEELTIPVKLENESLDPGTIVVKNGDRVTVQIDSSEAGEFHLHGYDIEMDLEAGQVNDFYFVADIEGRFIITFHGTDAAEEGTEEHDEEGDEHDEEENGEEEELQVGVVEVRPR